MNCYFCGNDKTVVVSFFDKPDKYLKAMGVKENHREWLYCPFCGLYQNKNTLSNDELKEAYSKYRDESFRKTTVDKDFKKITSLSKSENLDRVVWLNVNCVWKPIRSMLDIGSGFGVFPYEMGKTMQEVVCVEPEETSANFIEQELHFRCYRDFYTPFLIEERFDLVTLVHVLEHFRDPMVALWGIHRNNIKKNGLLFIEVPDSIEFDYLPQSHDEFNSLHLFFFSVGILDNMLRKVGFTPFKIERIKYKDRNLSRIRMLCRAE